MNSATDHDPTQAKGTANAQGGADDARDHDSQLVARALENDEGALEELVLRHQAEVSRLLWRFVRTRADLDDLVQETFLRMVRGLSRWESRQPFQHWILRIATNTGRDFFRRQATRRRHLGHQEIDEETAAMELVEPGLDPAARAAANEVKELLEQLSPDDRTLLTLHHLEGWKIEQIARQLGWTVTATKLRAWRARRRLRNLFSDESP